MSKKLIHMVFILGLIIIVTGCSPEDVFNDEGQDQEEVGVNDGGKEEDREKEEDGEDTEQETPDEEPDPQPAPEFTLSNLEGDDMTIPEDVEGTLMIKFWHSRCRFCVEELEDIQEVYQEIEDDPSKHIYTINVQEGEDHVASFMEEQGYDFPVLLDEEGVVMKKYVVNAFPMTYIIDRDNNLTFRHIGQMSFDFMESELNN